jgi:glutamyl-tRNA synthetase
VAVGRYREQGFLPEAMLNYFALLGWSLDDSTTLIDKDALIANFSLERVSSNPGAWDMQKLLWMNGQYIMGLGLKDLADRLEPFLTGAGLFTAGDPEARAELERIVPLIRERLKVLSEAPALTAFFFEEISPEISSLDVLKGEAAIRMLKESRRRLAGVDPFVAPHIEEALRETAASLGLKPRVAFQPIRLSITSSRVSPPLFESMEIVGRERCLARLDRAVALAEELAP